MQHGECISTAVRVMDRGARLSTTAACFYLHTIDLSDEREGERREDINVCDAAEEEEEEEEEEGVEGCGEVCPIAGVIKFVSRTHLVSPGCSSLIHNRC